MEHGPAARFRTIHAVRRTACSIACVLPFLIGGGADAQSTAGWIAYGNDAARTSFTDASLSPTSVKPAWYTPISGRVSSQALVAQDVPSPGLKTVYVATTRGIVYALAENGYVRWRVDLGQLERVCQQIDGYGVTGTPAIDVASRTLYVADAFGRFTRWTWRREPSAPVGRSRSTATSGASSSGARSRSSTARSTSGPARTATAR